MFKSIETQYRDANALDWDAAIDLNRAALIRLLTVMVAALGMKVGGSVERVPLRVRLMVMRLLRPAESALRRLVFLRARDMPDAEYVPGPKRDKAAKRSKTRSRSVSLPLFDPRKKHGQRRRKRAPGPGPRISFFDGTDRRFAPKPQAPKPLPDDLVDAETLCRRLNALAKVLNDLEGAARRLKRLQARRKLSPRLSGQGVLRINTAPGHRKRGRSVEERSIDAVLTECQTLARRWITDTS
jgi:hypothetical protein